MKNNKTKSGAFLRRALLLTLAVMCVISFSACFSKGEKIVWSNLILGDKLPEIPDAKGELHNNSAENLDLDILGITAVSYNTYLEECKAKSFTIDAETTSTSFTAFNSEGYKLNLSYYESNSEMQIYLDAPMELEPIAWPTGTAGKLLPAPKSTIGQFSYEYDDNFLVYIGDTTKEDFWDYVTTCSEAGFNVDYSKGDDHYYADNADGWDLDLNYEGFNIMKIYIDAPEEETTAETEATTTQTKPAETEKPSEKQESDDASINSDFKTAMDSYENFMGEYVEFMKEYNDNPTDLTLIAEYAEISAEYAEAVEDFEKWADEDLSADELSYYFEVQGRVAEKLLEMY